MSCPYTYFYDEAYAITVAVRKLLENLQWANGQRLKPEQITAIWQDSSNNKNQLPRVAVYTTNDKYFEFDPQSVEYGEDWELYKDAEYNATLKIEVLAENPVQRSFLMRAIKHKLLDATRKGTYSRFITVDKYLIGKDCQAKLLLKGPKFEDNERNIANKICKGILEGDITFPIYTIHSSTMMLPEYVIEVDDIVETLPDPDLWNK
jgi:hypothetical protein